MTMHRFSRAWVFLLTASAAVLAGCASSAKVYDDGRTAAQLRMEARDYGVVLHHGEGPDSCDAHGARDAWVFEYQGMYYVHYDGAGLRGWIACRAKSKDLMNWEREGPILDLGKPGDKDSKSASYGIPVHDGKQWHLFYMGTTSATDPPDLIPVPPYFTLKATAKTPLGPWKKQKGVIPFLPKAGTFYSATASPGHTIENPGGGYLHFFSGSEGEHLFKRSIGIARTTDLNSAWSIDAQPIVPPEEQIENSSLFYQEENKTWFLFTNHVGIAGGNEFTDAIWVYWTKDLNTWDPKAKAVVLDGNNCTWSKRIIGLPSVLRVGSKLALMYDGTSNDDLGHMRRDIGLAWLDLPLIPPKVQTETNP